MIALLLTLQTCKCESNGSHRKAAALAVIVQTATAAVGIQLTLADCRLQSEAAK